MELEGGELRKKTENFIKLGKTVHKYCWLLLGGVPLQEGSRTAKGQQDSKRAARQQGSSRTAEGQQKDSKGASKQQKGERA